LVGSVVAPEIDLSEYRYRVVRMYIFGPWWSL